jgi:hypothetical protein
MQRRGTKRNGGRSRPNYNNNAPPVQATRFLGSLKTSVEQTVVLDLVFDTTVTSTAAGVVADVLSDIPTGSPDWTSCQALYAEYRILAMSIQFVPNITGGNVAATAYAPFYVIWDANPTATPLASYAAATNYPISKYKSINQPWLMSHRMYGVEESTFVPVTSSIADYAFRTYATGLTNSTSYGRYVIRWKTQFRGRQ